MGCAAQTQSCLQEAQGQAEKVARGRGGWLAYEPMYPNNGESNGKQMENEMETRVGAYEPLSKLLPKPQKYVRY